MAIQGRPPKQIVDGKFRCCRCGELKPIDKFGPSKTSNTGLYGACNSCCVEKMNKRHTQSLKQAFRAIYHCHLATGKRGSLRRQSFVTNSCVTPEFLASLWAQQDGKCAVTEVPMTHIRGNAARIWTNLSIDRIDPDIGYVADNCRLVCRGVNVMKNAMTDREMLQWAALIVNGPCKYC